MRRRGGTLLDEYDPLEDAPTTHVCEGGWKQVSAAYAESIVPDPKPLPLDATSDEISTHEAHARSIPALRKAARDSYYPCRECQPELFLRWANGCFGPRHNARRCELCSDGKSKR